MERRERFGGTTERDQRYAELRQRADVTRIVPAGALDLAARLGQLALLRECQPEPGARVGVGRLSGEDQLELRGGFGRASGLEQRQPEVPPVMDVARPERHDALEMSDGGAEVATVAGERARLPVAEGTVGVDVQAASPDLVGVAPDRELLEGQGREPHDPGQASEADTRAHRP